MRKKDKLKSKLNSNSKTNQQLIQISETLKKYQEITKLKKYDIDLDEYLIKDDFRKEALYIIGT